MLWPLIRVDNPASLVSNIPSAILDETVAQIKLCTLNGIGKYEACLGRALKPQAKALQLQCYMGTLDTDERPSGTGSQFFSWPVIVEVYYKRTDTTMGGTLSKNIATYMDELFQRFNKLRPGQLTVPITNFFLTEVSIQDIDVGSGNASAGKNQENQIIGFLTVKWQFWRPY